MDVELEVICHIHEWKSRLRSSRNSAACLYGMVTGDRAYRGSINCIPRVCSLSWQAQPAFALLQAPLRRCQENGAHGPGCINRALPPKLVSSGSSAASLRGDHGACKGVFPTAPSASRRLHYCHPHRVRECYILDFSFPPLPERQLLQRRRPDHISDRVVEAAPERQLLQ